MFQHFINQIYPNLGCCKKQCGPPRRRDGENERRALKTKVWATHL